MKNPNAINFMWAALGLLLLVGTAIMTDRYVRQVKREKDLKDALNGKGTRTRGYDYPFANPAPNI